MAKRTGHEEPMYRVWRSDLETREDGETYAAIDVKSAARRYAEDGVNHRGWEQFPMVVHVEVIPPFGSGPSNKVWVVEVERFYVPEYKANEPLPAKMPKQVHALRNSRAICCDIRLDKVPAEWPEGQTWLSLQLFTQRDPDTTLKGFKRCPECERRAPRQIEGLKQIGAWPL